MIVVFATCATGENGNRRLGSGGGESGENGEHKEPEECHRDCRSRRCFYLDGGRMLGGCDFEMRGEKWRGFMEVALFVLASEFMLEHEAFGEHHHS